MLELNLLFEDPQLAEAKLQNAKAVRSENTSNLEKVRDAASRLQAKFTKESIDTHQSSQAKLEELRAAQSLAALFRKFFEMLQADTADELKELGEVVYRMRCTSGGHRQEIRAAIAYRLAQFRSSFEEAHLAEAMACFERHGLPLKKVGSAQKLLPAEDEMLLCNCLGVDTELSGAFKLLEQPFRESLVSRLYSKTLVAVSYHFLQKGSELYRAEEPLWMFNYIGDALEANIGFLLRELRLSKAQCCFLISTSFELLIKEPIVSRLRVDMPAFERERELLFAFVEGMLVLQQNINSRYESVAGKQESLLQLIVRTFEKERLLERLLQFEEECFESRVFRDFVHIDYSRINLKNVEAFNITQNFNLMFDKLYCKYLPTGRDTLAKVNAAYLATLDRMIRHTKTAFDRIYNNNPGKFDILAVFRKVEDELRGSTAKYRQYLTDIDKILQLLTTDMKKAFVQLAEATLLPLNKKISKVIIDCPLENGRFSSSEVDMPAMNALHRQWKLAMDRLNEIYYYRDPPLTRMIFMLLQKLEFTKEGLAAFIIAFEPFLKDIFSSEQARLIKSMIFMEKSKLADVTKERSNIVRTFLTEEQIDVIARLNYTP